MKLINKFLLNQIAMAIFGVMVCLPMPMFGKVALIIASLVAALFFVALLYDNAWDEGFRDSNRISNGRLNFRAFHGARVALFAYIPTILFWSIWAVSVVLNRLGVEFLNSVGAVCKAIVVFFCNATYLGIVYTFNNQVNEVALLLSELVCLLPAVIAYFLGYRLGIIDKQIKTVFGIKPTLGEGAKNQKNKQK